ncbi:glycosyl hydrolase family 18 protein [Calidifontibacillus oryziterrae]|uniref:glycosyl hydrolase family 18 protein n=1 Tax=Calidifontibacillus oryziterrae TaxID=1191699 RepID=UPI0002EF08E8|nr:glycosyl hydrolase family 18 protein [Calidifontibacillus oryziterrae]
MAIHIVQPGDSLWEISRNYNVTIQTIVAINGIQLRDRIVPGLALYIPDESFPFTMYEINAGDTLWSLAQRYNIDVTNIIAANREIDPNRLFVGQLIRIPLRRRLSLQTLGFIVPYSTEQSLVALNQVGEYLTYIAIVSYSFTDEGWAYRRLMDIPIIERAKQLGIKPLLMIRNMVGDNFSPELVGNVLANPMYRRNLIASIVNLASQFGYNGVSIDFEFIPPPQRYDFITFLNDLKAALGNRILHVNVHAKTEDIPTNRIIGAYDYLEIGKVADIVAVMTMDYGYPTGPPNPVSPLWWMEDVVQYSLNLINASKLQVAFPLYGYDWRLPDNATTALSVLSAQNLAISEGVPIQYDQIAETPYYFYRTETAEYAVWFEDIRSFLNKYQLVSRYNLLGVTYWQIQFDFPQNWVFIDRNIIVVK